jgi:rhodanese-related sulfurtransferase
MIDLIKRAFGIKPPVDFTKLVNQGAIILDVRTLSEYSSGHIKKSLHIPLNEIATNLHKLPHKDIPIITCCASGMRSSKAAGILKANGHTTVYNGGGWSQLQNKL